VLEDEYCVSAKLIYAATVEIVLNFNHRVKDFHTLTRLGRDLGDDRGTVLSKYQMEGGVDHPISLNILEILN